MRLFLIPGAALGPVEAADNGLESIELPKVFRYLFWFRVGQYVFSLRGHCPWSPYDPVGQSAWARDNGSMSEAQRTWGGRFEGSMDDLTRDYTAGVDRDLYEQDIVGSVAHARMLGATGIIPKDEADAIVAGLGVVSAVAIIKMF